jgi:hypothetical protein
MEIAQIKHRVDLNKLLPENPVTCELGVAEGYFSEHMLRDWNSSHHYAVDNWGTLPVTGDGAFPQDWHNANYEKSMAKLNPYGDRVTVLRGLTWRMAQSVKDGSLDLVYLDAAHYYEAVKQDLEAWYSKVKPGGIVAGHDFVNPAYGVLQAVSEFANRLSIKVHVIPEHHESDAGFWFYKPK